MKLRSQLSSSGNRNLHYRWNRHQCSYNAVVSACFALQAYALNAKMRAYGQEQTLGRR
jgi:hypothetical protein